MSDLKEIQEVEEEEEKLEKEVEPIKKEKKPRTPKQLEVFEKARMKLQENNKLRSEAKKQMEEESKSSFEGKVIKKALEIKKKQILRESILDEISSEDENTPLEKIKKIIKKKAVKQFPSVIVPSVIYI